MTHVMHNFAPPRRRAPRGLTLIEIMVVVGILVLLAVILLAVTTSVGKKAEISRTQMILKGLDGIARDYETQTGQPLLLNSGGLATGTVYPITGTAGLANYPAANQSFVNLIYRLPQTRDELQKLLQNAGGASERLKTAANGAMYITDVWNNPIEYIRQGQRPGTNADAVQGVPASNWALATRTYFRSAGPDGQMDLVNDTAVNADDILSYEP